MARLHFHVFSILLCVVTGEASLKGPSARKATVSDELSQETQKCSKCILQGRRNYLTEVGRAYVTEGFSFLPAPERMPSLC